MLYSILITIFMVILGLYDWYSTQNILQKGGYEQNSVAKFGMDILGMNGYLAAKCIFCAVAVWFVSFEYVWFALFLDLYYLGFMIHNSKSVK